MRRDEEGLPATAETGPQAIAERLLALATLAPHSERVVRRAWRSAQRLDAELDVLVVRPPGRPPSSEDRKRLEELRRLTAMLGARLRVEEGEDVAAVVVRVARSLGTTYVLMGTPDAAPRAGALGRRLRSVAADAPAAGAAGRRRAHRRRSDPAPARRLGRKSRPGRQESPGETTNVSVSRRPRGPARIRRTHRVGRTRIARVARSS